jgi:hypothetical protein
MKRLARFTQAYVFILFVWVPWNVPSISFAALLALVSLVLPTQPPGGPSLVFSLAYALSLWPVRLVQTSDWAFRTFMRRLERQRADGVINKREYYEIRKRAIRWFKERWFGRERIPPPDSPATPPTPSSAS